MRDKNVSPLPQIRSFGIRFESRKKFHAQTVLVPSIWSLKLPLNHSHPDPPDTPYMPSYSLLPVTARREPHVCNQRSTICTCTGQLLRPVTHVSASEENVSGDWQLRLAAMWWERGTVPARATRRIKILVATAANYSRTSPTGIVSVTKRATYVVLSYTVYVNEPRSDPLNSPTRTSRAKIETNQFRETLQDRKPRGDSPIFEVVKPVLRKRIGMPTCDCQNGTLDESEEHVCSLKPPVEKDKVKEPKESPNPVRYSDGSVRLRNPNIELMDQDILYHLALGSGSHDLVEMFGDIKFVCMGGTPKRMEHFANYIMQEIGHKLPAGTTLLDITKNSYRYSMFKVGPVLSISHGMGIPSVSILLHEVIKLMYHAKIRDPIFIRIGTCGGIGHEGGTVIISEEALDETMKPYLELMVLGKLIRRPAKLDRQLARDLKALAHRDDPYDTVIGKTMCSNDFYEGQGRLDGAFCEFTEADKMEYLTKLQKAGVVNIEMESLCFAALTHHAGIQSAVVCVTLLDRLKGDQVLAPKEVLEEWQMRPQKLIARYITTYLQRKGRLSLEGQHGSMYVKSPRRFKLVQQESENYD